jgi:aspartyl-tRNA(Asn)/glutamyl-tRNA(Gln) amidotransferase subunit C
MSHKDEKISIEHIAKIARLELTQKEKQKFEHNLKEILNAFAIIDEVKTRVEPSFQPLSIENVFRKDEIKESLTRDEALKNTKHKEKGFFKGPKVV